MDSALLRLLQAANPWLVDHSAFPRAVSHRIPDPFVEREVPGLDGWPVPGKAHMVVGARQAGKSSLLWSWLRQRGQAPLFLNCEEAAIRSWCRSATLVSHDARGLVAPETPIFIDEAQHLDEPGLFVKGLVDSGLENPLFVTGSSAFHLEAKTRESLAGRAVRAVIHPFSLREVAAPFAAQPPLLRASKTRDSALRHMVLGGYPEAWLGDDPETALYHLVDAFVVRDASDRLRIEHVDAFRNLLRLVAGQVGNLANFSEWASLCQVSRTTIDNYLAILNDAHVLASIRPFVGGRRAELTHRSKVYFRDPGIRNAVARQLGAFEDRPDRGALLEGWLASELHKRLSLLAPLDTLRYWRSRSGAEVDFVVERPRGLVAFEAKASPLRRPTLSRSARSFIEAYRPDSFVVVNLGLEADEVVAGTDVRWVGPEAFVDPKGLLD